MGQCGYVELIWSSCPFGLNLHRTSAWEALMNESPRGCWRDSAASVASLEAGWVVIYQMWDTFRGFKWLLDDTASYWEAVGYLPSPTVSPQHCDMVWFRRHQAQRYTDGWQGHIHIQWIAKQHNLPKKPILWHSWLSFTSWTLNLHAVF